jgi:hypothetical protein
MFENRLFELFTRILNSFARFFSSWSTIKLEPLNVTKYITVNRRYSQCFSQETTQTGVIRLRSQNLTD